MTISTGFACIAPILHGKLRFAQKELPWCREWKLKKRGNIKKLSVIPRPVLTLVVGIRFFFRQQYISAWSKGERIATSLRSSQ